MEKFVNMNEIKFTIGDELEVVRGWANVWNEYVYHGDPVVNQQQLNGVYCQLVEEREQEVDYELFLYT